jgi:anaerobic ribonucleoside-triphosphate reductase/predicted transcriptional regulator
LSQDSISQSEIRPGGVLQTASRRVRMIFSVMASPNRIDILRILNSKGPLTYSELKSLAGFKSKKESGKFAYHLRKLLRQSLVALNKAERRYTITNLGKLVLSLARQIEERSIIESGKMYVRTSRHSIEEFNSNRIIQSLVREANMPLEQAHKITEEVENKVYKFQTAYLTSSLIRETVNSVLIEHGFEEYRTKLARLGLPTSDVVELFNGSSNGPNDIDSILSEASVAVFSENLLFNILPKDITDMHLAGELNISNSGLWGLIPDTIFYDSKDLVENGLDSKGKYLSVSRILPIKKLEDLTTTFPRMVSLLCREAYGEVVFDNLIGSIFNKVQYNANDVESLFTATLLASSISRSYLPGGHPVVTITISADDLESNIVAALLNGYRKYVEHTPVPRIGVQITCQDYNSILMHSEAIGSIGIAGGMISVSNKGVRTHTGVLRNTCNDESGLVIGLQSLAVNLPRLAYQSNKDETYFRARLALMLKPAVTALAIRKKVISDIIRKGILPTLAQRSQLMQLGKMNLVINLTGARESVYNILGHDLDGEEILLKVLRTAADVVADNGRQQNENSISIAMIPDDSAKRLASLDAEKYGKMQQNDERMPEAYSQGTTILGKDLLENKNSILSSSNTISSLLSGGFSVNVDITGISNDDTNAILNAAYDLNFFRLISKNKICSLCGTRCYISQEKCQNCKSPYLSIIY